MRYSGELVSVVCDVIDAAKEADAKLQSGASIEPGDTTCNRILGSMWRLEQNEASCNVRGLDLEKRLRSCQTPNEADQGALMAVAIILSKLGGSISISPHDVYALPKSCRIERVEDIGSGEITFRLVKAP